MTGVMPARVARREMLGGLAGTLAVATAAPARAAIDPSLFDIRRYVYVPSATTPDVTIIDADTDRITGSLHTGIVAQHVAVSRQAATLIAADGRAGEVALVDVFTGAARTLLLPAVTDQLTVAAGGRLVAAVHQAAGTITLVDLDSARVATVIAGLPKLRDVMFGAQDTELYIAAEGIAGIGVIDLATARLSHEIATWRPNRAGVAALARTPDGRRLLAQPQGGGAISVIDLEAGRAVAELPAGSGTVGLFPSGTGRFLLIPDNATATLAVFRAEHLDQPVALRSATDAAGVHPAWLDSVAFVPCGASHRLLVYDLDTLHPAGEIALPGPPLRGAVTTDSRTLYLPIRDPPQVVAVDGASRRIATTFDLPGPPLLALVAGGWGICH